MGSRSEGQVVGPNFVGYVSIPSHTITTNQNNIHLTTTHQQATGTINNHRRWNTTAAELPSGQSRPLQTRASFVQPGMFQNPLMMGRKDHTKGRADSSRGNGTGMTVVKNTAILWQ
jgi:hypothetical protein